MASILSDDGETVIAGVEKKNKQRCFTCMRRLKPGRDVCKCGTPAGKGRVAGRSRISKGRQKQLDKSLKALQKELQRQDKAALRYIEADTAEAFRRYPAFNHAEWQKARGLL